MTYLDEQIAAGFHKGDVVLVTRTARDREGGWCNGWAEEYMDLAVGQILVITTEPYSEGGISLSDGYAYPYFVLQKTNDIKLKDIKVGTVLIKSGVTSISSNLFYIVEVIKEEDAFGRTMTRNGLVHNKFSMSLKALSCSCEVVK